MTTRNVTNIVLRDGIISAGGPEYEMSLRESFHPIRRLTSV